MWNRFATHPITPLVLGAILSFAVPGLVVPKSYALLAFWIWLCIDVWIWLKDAKNWKRYHYALFCTGASLTASAMLYIDRIFLQQMLDDFQSDAYQNLAANVTLPPSGDPFRSFFEVTNGGKSRIAKHTIICGINIIATSTAVWENLGGIVTSSDAPLGHGGDSESDPCLAVFGGGQPRCFDVTMRFTYSLEVQPELFRDKYFRFVGIANANKFMWLTEPVEQVKSYCASFVR